MTATAIDYYSVQSQLVQNARAGGRGDVLIPHYDGGKLRVQHFNYTAPVGGIAAAKVISLGYISQGRIIPGLTCLHTTDFGGTGTVSIGLNEYKDDVYPQDTNAAAPAALWSNLDTSGAALNTTLAATGVAAVKNSGLKVNGFVELILTLNTDAMQAGATIDLFVATINGQ